MRFVVGVAIVEAGATKCMEIEGGEELGEDEMQPGERDVEEEGDPADEEEGEEPKLVADGSTRRRLTVTLEPIV